MTDTVHRITGLTEKRNSQPAKPGGLLLLVLGGLGACVVALVGSSILVSAAMVVVGVVIVMIAWLGRLAMTTVRDGYVRIDPLAEGLRFVPPRSIERAETVAFATFVLPGALVATAYFTGLDPHAISSPLDVMLVLASIGLPAYYLWTLRAPRGLTLTPEGVTGVRRATRVDLTWDDMRGTTVKDGPGRGTLVIPGPKRRLVRLDAMRFGSDAYVVAAIITYFVEHERERAVLTDGPRALERFNASP